jgi:sec-independent protein translocase protein TatB
LLPSLSRIYDGHMSFSDTIFLFFLALILFGPKKLPEMAKQAGRLLAELRRASNEFRSQIETEIAHLEVQKEAQTLEEQKEVQKNAGTNQTAASSAPPGTVASLSVNPAASESIPHSPTSTATLAATTEAVPTGGHTAVGSTPALEPISETTDPASQASHV